MHRMPRTTNMPLTHLAPPPAAAVRLRGPYPYYLSIRFFSYRPVRLYVLRTFKKSITQVFNLQGLFDPCRGRAHCRLACGAIGLRVLFFACRVLTDSQILQWNMNQRLQADTMVQTAAWRDHACKICIRVSKLRNSIHHTVQISFN